MRRCWYLQLASHGRRGASLVTRRAFESPARSARQPTTSLCPSRSRRNDCPCHPADSGCVHGVGPRQRSSSRTPLRQTHTRTPQASLAFRCLGAGSDGIGMHDCRKRLGVRPGTMDRAANGRRGDELPLAQPDYRKTRDAAINYQDNQFTDKTRRGLVRQWGVRFNEWIMALSYFR